MLAGRVHMLTAFWYHLADLWLFCVRSASSLHLQVCVCPPQKPGMDLADTYITFVRQNQDVLRDRINDELYIEKVFDVSAPYLSLFW